MNPNLPTLSNGSLVWSDFLPPAFKGVRLPGGILTSATGAFGSICIQEFQSKYFTIRYNVLDILQELVLKTNSKQTSIHTAINLKGIAQHQAGNNLQWQLRQNQFSVLHAISPQITSVYNENIHISFDTFISMNLVKEILPLFPSFNNTITNEPPPHLLHDPSLWAVADTLDTVYSVLHCKYENDLRRWFFKARVRDLFFSYLVQLNGYDPAGKMPSEKEIQAVYKAEQIISSDIAKHTHIPELAKKVLLNEFSFKAAFKKIFGMGPYEYLVRQRMKKAKELLENGLSVKEVAAQTGYRSTDFTSAFINFYHSYPSAVRKKKS